MKQLVKLAFLLLLSVNSVNAQNEVNAPYSRFVRRATANYTPTISAMGSVSRGVFNPLVVNYNNRLHMPLGIANALLCKQAWGIQLIVCKL